MSITVRAGRPGLRLLSANTLISVRRVRLLRRICFGTDPLLPRYPTLIQTGKRLRNPTLQALLEREEIGTWSMSPLTLDFLESEIQKRMPRAILEFGSGLSTVCLAQYIAEVTNAVGTRVCSVEQNPAFVESTIRKLQTLGIDDLVKIYHAPLRKQVIAGHVTTCYSLSSEVIDTVKALQPDFIVIDGPAADFDARFGTLPLIQPYLAGAARFYLDDALRDGELDIANRWAGMSGISVEGIYLTEKGMLLGEVRGQRLGPLFASENVARNA